MLSALAKLIKVLNSETEPGQISLGFAFAMIAGFTPLLSLHNLLVLFLILILRVNLSAFLIGLAFFTGVAYLIDPLFHALGLAALTAGGLEGLWTAMYNSTLWRIEHFNNTIVMGSLLVSLVLFIPLIIVSNILIRKYREHFLQWILKTRIAQILKASKFYQTYQRVSGWGGSS
ncbi:MAG TPA: TIGR03546 family protein [Nitrospiria bacterium]|nr:TIGR03546 family protein [Nitrospiria bacterium]